MCRHTDGECLVLVVADGEETQAELRAPDPPGDGKGDERHEQHRVVEGRVVEVTAPRRHGKAQSGAAAGEPNEVLREELDHEHHRDGHDHERRGARPQRNPSEGDGKERGEDACHGDEQEGLVPAGDSKVRKDEPEGVRTESKERGVAE